MDGDGVRDDFQRYMVMRLDGSQELYNATFMIHKSLIRFLTNLSDDTIIDEEKENLMKAKKCLVGTLEDTSLADTIIRESYAKTLNNRKRLFC